ncbi:MAG: class I SAM-dependent methyltransferase [Alphaproteobacteria bacterium]
MSQEVIREHYSRLGSRYEEYLYYSDDFVRRLTSKMIEDLDLHKEDVLVDLGGGTGMYSKDILEQVSLDNPVVLVDPFEEMLAHARDDERLECVCTDALSFSQQPRQYDKVLMKEAVHHVEDRPRLFDNVHDQLRDEGTILLVHVPPDLDYPLFEKALERSKRWQADPDELEEQLSEAGFEVERDGLDLSHRMPKETYFRMVEAQYMSVLSSFSDGELEEGLAEMAETYADTDVLEFTDRFDFIAGRKS